MTGSERRTRLAGFALSIAATSAVAAWAFSQSTAVAAPAVGFAGIAGVVTFSGALDRRLTRTMATGLVLVGTAAALGTLQDTPAARSLALAVAGAVLFLAAEIADRALDQKGQLEHRPGVRRWSPLSLLAVAVGSAGVSYGVVSARGFLSGGGPAALAAGTAGAALVAAFTVLALRSSLRGGRL